MALHQYDYILAVGFIFAFLDAWNIGTSRPNYCNNTAAKKKKKKKKKREGNIISDVSD